MKPAPFEYTRARSLDEALGALAGDAEAKVLAGGQSLVPMMNMRLARPSRLIDINPLAELAGVVAAGDGGLVIGALTRHTELLTSPLERAPLLAAATGRAGGVRRGDSRAADHAGTRMGVAAIRVSKLSEWRAPQERLPSGRASPERP